MKELILVSIPFIAGQWSLRNGDQKALAKRPNVSIPFIAGQWSLPLDPGVHLADHPWRVSIPFIAGQWSLHSPAPARGSGFLRRSQSPSLRGSGRFSDAEALIQRLRKSQSPSLRGSGRFEARREGRGKVP